MATTVCNLRAPLMNFWNCGCCVKSWWTKTSFVISPKRSSHHNAKWCIKCMTRMAEKGSKYSKYKSLTSRSFPEFSSKMQAKTRSSHLAGCSGKLQEKHNWATHQHLKIGFPILHYRKYKLAFICIFCGWCGPLSKTMTCIQFEFTNSRKRQRHGLRGSKGSWVWNPPANHQNGTPLLNPCCITQNKDPKGLSAIPPDTAITGTA